jgi:1,4-alpha-glucan branching enzyme
MAMIKANMTTAKYVAVHFTLPKSVGAKTADILGEFTHWTPVPMHKTDDGGFQIHLALDPGKHYRFRYRLDNERWENDAHCDGYVPNEFGTEDSVVDLTKV